MIVALAPLVTLEASIGPVGWASLGVTALGAGIYALIKGINNLQDDHGYAETKASVDKLNDAIKRFVATESEIDKAISNLSTQTSTVSYVNQALQAQLKSLQNTKRDINTIKKYQDANGNVFKTYLIRNIYYDYGTKITYTALQKSGGIGYLKSYSQNIIAQNKEITNALNSTGVVTLTDHEEEDRKGGADNFWTWVENIVTANIDGLINLLTGGGQVITQGISIPTSLTELGKKTGSKDVPIPTPTTMSSAIIAAYPTITPDVVDFEDPTKRAFTQDLFSSSIDYILNQSIWWNRLRTRIKVIVRNTTATATRTKDEVKNKRRRKKLKKPKKPPKQPKKKNNLPDKIKRIDVDVSSVSGWIRAVSFEFPTQKDLYADDRGTLTFYLKKGGQIKFVRVYRGTFSVIADYYGTGYRLWSQFWKKRMVNRWKFSWILKKITKVDREIAIPQEIKNGNCKYK